MEISPDNIAIYVREPIILNATILFTWLTMGLLVGVSGWVTRRLSVRPQLPPWQNLLEIVVDGICNQIREITQQDPEPYLSFVGTLFLFIVTSNLLTVVPGYHAPTGSLSTTAALAICVFFAVPIFGIRQQVMDELQSQFTISQSVEFTTAPNLLCGIEIKLAGQEIVWSLDTYLQTLEQRLSTTLTQEGASHHEHNIPTGAGCLR